MGYRILGWFENGFRHVSNKVRPVRLPADMKGMTIRVLPSKVQARTFELLGAVPKIMDLSEAIEAVKAGTLDAQENPFFNTVTYGVHNFHKFHTATTLLPVAPDLPAPPSFDSWPRRSRRAARRRQRRCRLPARSAREEKRTRSGIRKSAARSSAHTRSAQGVRRCRHADTASAQEYSRELLSR